MSALTFCKKTGKKTAKRAAKKTAAINETVYAWNAHP